MYFCKSIADHSASHPTQVKVEPRPAEKRGGKAAVAAPLKPTARGVKKEVKVEAVAVKKERKVFTLPGQTRDTPLEVLPLRM